MLSIYSFRKVKDIKVTDKFPQCAEAGFPFQALQLSYPGFRNRFVGGVEFIKLENKHEEIFIFF